MNFTNIQIDTDALPTVEEVSYEKLERNYLIIRFIGASFFMIFLLVGIIILFSATGWWKLTWALVPGIGVWFLILVLQILMVFKGFEKKAFALREKDVVYQSGWIFQSNTVIPFNRVQHVDLNQGPLDRAFDIASINIYTAGGQGSDITIPGLEPSRAQNIKDYILRKAAIDEEE